MRAQLDPGAAHNIFRTSVTSCEGHICGRVLRFSRCRPRRDSLRDRRPSKFAAPHQATTEPWPKKTPDYRRSHIRCLASLTGHCSTRLLTTAGRFEPGLQRHQLFTGSLSYSQLIQLTLDSHTGSVLSYNDTRQKALGMANQSVFFHLALRVFSAAPEL
jgi:hypothetical protein